MRKRWLLKWLRDQYKGEPKGSWNFVRDHDEIPYDLIEE